MKTCKIVSSSTNIIYSLMNQLNSLGTITFLIIKSFCSLQRRFNCPIHLIYCLEWTSSTARHDYWINKFYFIRHILLILEIWLLAELRQLRATLWGNNGCKYRYLAVLWFMLQFIGRDHVLDRHGKRKRKKGGRTNCNRTLKSECALIGHFTRE